MARVLLVNGERHEVDVDDDTPLLWVLRDLIGLTGTKFGCGIAMCGACTVHVDGEARRACITPIKLVSGSDVRTIESLNSTLEGAALQRAWTELDVVQCGYCQPGQLMSAAALISANSKPDDDAIDAVMSANICRCGTYGRIRAGVKLAASYLGDPTSKGQETETK